MNNAEATMQRRFEYHKAAPGAMRAMVWLQEYVEKSGLERLTLAIIAINGWNRLAIAFREVPGTYPPQGSGNK